jgi:hypothetical protein
MLTAADGDKQGRIFQLRKLSESSGSVLMNFRAVNPI